MKIQGVLIRLNGIIEGVSEIVHGYLGLVNFPYRSFANHLRCFWTICSQTCAHLVVLVALVLVIVVLVVLVIVLVVLVVLGVLGVRGVLVVLLVLAWQEQQEQQ